MFKASVVRFAPLFKYGSSVQPIIRNKVLILSSVRSISSSHSLKFFNNKPSSKEVSAEQAETIKKFGETLKNNPEIFGLIEGFKDLLERKGIQTGGKPPSMTQMMRIIADKEFRDHLSKLKDALEAANINIKQEDLGTLTEFFMSQSKIKN
ncbi:hypothetical protein DFJ63DRAFT_317074 [Scheffersomyces coipomensis]|uniref:uncharacterized protein n=1 Tax=Scheffersomyces coipomensis TaxID=1788519 RepID=UPI00315DC986